MKRLSAKNGYGKMKTGKGEYDVMDMFNIILLIVEIATRILVLVNLCLLLRCLWIYIQKNKNG